jgi:hypothetical protein
LSLFEIDLNSNFKFTDQPAFLSHNDFIKYLTLNNVKTQNIPFENYHFHISSESILNHRFHYPYHNDQDSALQSISVNVFDLYQQHFDRNSPTELSTKLFGCDRDTLLYPNWQLFYLGLESVISATYEQQQFSEEVENFQKISEIIQKEYWVRNIRCDLIFDSIEGGITFQEHLHEHLSAYKLSIYNNTANLIGFLKYLLHLHYIFKENEKYKLMWNLESSYIRTCIYMLMEYGMSYFEIVVEANQNRIGSQRTDLNYIYTDTKSYVQANNFSYANASIVTFINNVLNTEFDQQRVVDMLNGNERYLAVLDSIIELNQRYYGNKLSERTVMAVTRAVVLDVEEIIKEYLQVENCKLFNCLSSLDSSITYGGITGKESNKDFLNKFTNLIKDTPESVAKYLMIYYHTRNYIAHNIVEFNSFFYEEQQLIIKNVLNSVIFIMFYLEYLKAEEV